MFYEDVTIRAGETVHRLALAYGYAEANWRTVWDDSRNSLLASLRGAPENVQAGDVLQVPIPWRIVSRVLVAEANGAGFTADRDGRRGRRLNWVQTVNQDNQAIAGTTQFCTDACPATDDLPFYDTNADLAANPGWRRHFEDHPTRGTPPTAAMGTTNWRAIVSIAVVTGRRVTVFNSIFWGFDMAPGGAVSTVGPRPATGAEVTGHLNLLHTGVGTSGTAFGRMGWTFRRPPRELGDFVVPRGDVMMA